MIEKFKKKMIQDFKMTDLGLMRYLLSIQVKQNVEIIISQGQYCEDLSKKFHMSNCKTVVTPTTTNEKLSVEEGAQKVDTSIYRNLDGCLI